MDKKSNSLFMLIILVVNLIKLADLVRLNHQQQQQQQQPQQAFSSSIKSFLELKTKINKLIINTNDDEINNKQQTDLYVASTNHLYKIIDYGMNYNDQDESSINSSMLKIDIDLVTGPKPQKQQCAFITEYSSSSSSTQCIKYICDDDSNQVQQPSKVSLLKSSLLKQSQRQNLIDNDNRLLLIDSKNKHLIDCGTVDYGGCRLRQLSNLEIIGCNYSAPVIPFNSASGVIVTSSSSVSSTTRIDESSLYLMVSNEYDPIERLDKTDFPIFSIRYLASTQTTNSNEKQQQSQLRPPIFQSKYPIESMNYDQTIFNSDFHMKIVYSFKHNGFVYFLFTITNKMLSESCNRVDAESSTNQTTPKIVTRMLRICDSKWSASTNDFNTNQRYNRESSNLNNQETIDSLTNLLTSSATNSATLTETVIDCDDQLAGSKHYVLQSAYFHELPSKTYANDDSILFLTFNSSTSSSSSSSSAICKIRIKEIDNHYVSMLRKCLNGDNNYAELVSPYSNKNTWKTPCRCSVINDFSRKSTQSDDRKLFCHNDFFNYMNSRKTLTIKSINLDISRQIKPITSIVSLNTNYNEEDNKIVIIISTLDAQVYMLTYDINANTAQKYDQVNLLTPPANLLKQDSNFKNLPLSVTSALNINLAVLDTSLNQYNGSSEEFQRVLFVTYDRFLYKINLQNCEQFRSCESCLKGRNSQQVANPFCGWCVYKQECSLQQTCIQNSLSNFNDNVHVSEYFNSMWLTKKSDDTKCPSITEIKPSRFFNPISDLQNSDEYEFKLNLNLIPSIQYYCDFSFVSDQFLTETVRAIYLNENGNLRCDLSSLKTKYGYKAKLNPIKNKFMNLTVQIKAGSNSNSNLISTTNLYAFNCSYFKDCNQCLSKELSQSCTWCAKNSKCIFSNKIDECPNEVDFYKSNPNSNVDLCTSFSIESELSNFSKIEIPYSADSNLSQLARLTIKNHHKKYQTNFKCVFTKNKISNKFDNNITQKYTTSNFIWLSDDNINTNQTLFDCIYSPYTDQDQIDSNLAIQTIYMSVWWSSKPTSVYNNFDDIYLNSLDGWNQVKFKKIPNQYPIDLDQNDSKNGLLNELENIRDDYISNENDYLEINILNCELKASSCGKCMDKQLIDLGCGWCKSLSKCTMKKDCQNDKLYLDWANDLNDVNNYCPNPIITQITPKCGPKVNGGTKLTLIGENLGRKPNEVLVKMKPIKSEYIPDLIYGNDEINCKLIDDLYAPASKIICRTDPIYNNDIITLNDINEYSVYVITNRQNPDRLFTSFNQSNQFIYKYVTPEILSIEPSKGIKSGGTLLKITGKHLSCGSDFSIKFMSFGTYCTIINITSGSNKQTYHGYSLVNQEDDLDIIYCKTPSFNSNDWNQLSSASSSQPRSISSIQIRMDEYVQILNETRFKFEYVDDPKINSIEPDRTILSGGLIMNIKGKDFDSIQATNLIISPSPILANNRLNVFESIEDNVENDDPKNISIFKTRCNIMNSTLIQCQIPEIKDKRITQFAQKSIEYSLYIQFNDLTNKYANQQPGDLQQILIYPDPVFEEGQVFSDKAQIILIKGENLLRGVRESDYRVWVGSNVECNITSITMTIIACILPDQDTFLNKNKKNENPVLFFKKKRNLADEILKDNTIMSSNSAKSYEVRVQIGQRFIQTIGFIKYEKENLNKYDVIEIKYIIFAACLISLVLLITMIGFFVILKRRQNKQIRQLKRMQTEFENLEMRVARECKEAFTELQMDIGELANTLNQTGAPFHDFQTYCMKILFPNASDTEKYYMTTMIDLRLSSANKENVKNGVLMFSQLILNKKFLLTFIHTLEADTHSFLLQDRVNLASFLSICLHDRLDYFTDILMTLLAELIEKVIETKNNPKILFRRNESIAEKMLTNWFAFLLYDFIKDCAGTPLYILFLSIKQQIYKGPVDAITCEARYSLSEDKLIRQSIDYETITIRVQLQDFDDVMHEITVKVLNCDSITQVKEKILDSFFKGYPFSKRPHVEDLDLIYIPSEWSKNGRLVLYDEDKTCKIDNDDFKRTNTLAHYKITNGALLVLVSRQSYQLLHSSVNDACNSYTMLDTVKNAENMTLLSKSSKGSSSPPTYSKLSSNGLNEYNNGGVYSAMNGSSVGLTESLFNQNNSTRVNQNNSHHQLIISNNSNKNGATNNLNSNPKMKKYHLIKTNDLIHSTTPSIKDDKKQEIAAKLVSEVYLTRLLATKGGMQSYVDDFFETVFSTAHGSNVLPFAIKYLFDFLDEQANIHGITDPDVVYTWKSNSLPLRFWVNIIKNPDFVFDIFKSNIVDASLSVIASTFMDSCSQSKLDLNKESPSGKLLFYKEVHKYRKWVESYYSEIKFMPKINELDMSEMLAEESKKHSSTFNKNNAMYKLYNDYVKKYRVPIENSLNDEYQDPSVASINKHLNYRLQQVIYLMDAIEV